MSKLTRKFIVSLSAVFIMVVALSLALNRNFVERYFLYQEKREMNRICDELAFGALPVGEVIRTIGETEDVVIARVENTEDNDLLNQRLRAAFLDQGVSLKKYWLWDQDWQDAMESGRKMRLYHQDKLHYSLLVAYMPKDSGLLAVAKIIPSVGRTLELLSRVTLAVFTGAILVTLILIIFLVRRIVSPLDEIGKAARSIAAMDFKTVEIHTGDELETLAVDINHMSRSLRKARDELEMKNRQMKELLANVSHDLKTPVALIKAYASGMRDGMDDGTFLDTILAQNNRMERMIERLLDLAKSQLKRNEAGPVDVSRRLRDLITDYRLQEEKREVLFDCEIRDAVVVDADGEAVHLILSNLLSNAVKYAADGRINLCLSLEDRGQVDEKKSVGENRSRDAVLRIRNRIKPGQEIEPERLWEPFTVAEKSRNKGLSGTGLGLSIVRAAANQCGFLCGCGLEGEIITFWVRMPAEE